MSNKTECLLSTTGCLHVYNRGVDRNTIFHRIRDYDYFMELMADSMVDSNIRLLLHCLLPNHFHFVVQQAKAYAVSNFVKRVCEVYAKHLNSTRSRSGHLFQDRFKAKLVEDQASLIRLSRYIHFIPVTSGVVESISKWKYSSIQAYIDSKNQGFVTVDPILRLVGGRDEYLKFLREYDPAVPDSVWDFIRR